MQKKKWGYCSHRPAHKFPFVRKVTGRVAQMRDRVACPWSPEKLFAARKAFVRDCREGLLNMLSVLLTSIAGNDQTYQQMIWQQRKRYYICWQPHSGKNVMVPVHVLAYCPERCCNAIAMEDRITLLNMELSRRADRKKISNFYFAPYR